MPHFLSRVLEKSGPLEGEDISTGHWEDARHWLSIYADLLDFKRGILDRVQYDLSRMMPIARRAAEADLVIIESQMAGYQRRWELWQRRLSDLHGLSLDPEGRVIRYKDVQATLTFREFQLLKLFLDHPYRPFSVAQILTQAWGSPNLFPEQARSYVGRLRKILVMMSIPCGIVIRPGRGYALEFHADTSSLPQRPE